jgi:hypothetical protein
MEASTIAHNNTKTISQPLLPPPPPALHLHEEMTTAALMRRLLPHHPHDASASPPPPRRLRRQLQVLDTMLRGLYDRYLQRVPQVETIVNHIVQRSWQRYGPNTTIENDHIAFRSLLFLPPSQDGNPENHPHQHGIAYLERFFIDYCGYEKRDYYQFAEKKLNAYWYAPPNALYPRIFISELRVDELSSHRAQSILREAMIRPSTMLESLPLHDDENDDENVDVQKCLALGQAIVAALQAPLFEPRSLSYAKYECLKAESEYAAWVYGTNSHDMNHLTLAVHHLPEPIDELHHFNDMVAHELDIPLNAAQSPIQTSPDGLLLQSSTVAAPLAVEFYDDDSGDNEDNNGQRQTTTTRYIPGSYVEFAERRILPQFVAEQQSSSGIVIGREHRREGFETANANVIFESTFDRNKNNDNSDNNNVHNTTTTN